MNPRNLTREAIEELNDIEPYCFETDREEQWFNIGLQYGLDVADSDPISPWISIEDDLPCNHDDMYNMSGSFIYTNDVLALDGTRPVIVYMIFNDKTGEWKWNKPLNIKYWFPIPKLPK